MRQPKVNDHAPTLVGTHAIEHYTRAALSMNTRRAYRSDAEKFARWCALTSEPSLPASTRTVLAYIAEHADRRRTDGTNLYSAATLTRWVAGINWVHAAAGYLEPGTGSDMRALLLGVRASRASNPDTRRRDHATRAPALLLNDLRRILRRIDTRTWPAGVIGRRDHALLLLGWTGAFRRSELADLTCRDVTLHPEDGLHVRVSHSKTDQEGTGFIKAMPYGQSPLTCTACAYARWRAVVAAHDDTGNNLTELDDTHLRAATHAAMMRVLLTDPAPDTHVCRDAAWAQRDAAHPLERVFRAVHKSGAIRGGPITGEVVNHVVQRRAAAAEVNIVGLSGHSLRAGFITQADRAGASVSQIGAQTGQSDSTIERYRRHDNPLANNAITRLNL